MGLDKNIFNFTSSLQNGCSIIDVFIALYFLDPIAKHSYPIVYICMVPLHLAKLEIDADVFLCYFWQHDHSINVLFRFSTIFYHP